VPAGRDHAVELGAQRDDERAEALELGAVELIERREVLEIQVDAVGCAGASESERTPSLSPIVST